MSGNTSATGGVLRQQNVVPSDDALHDVLHDLIAGVLGLPGDLVRPRWQPKSPNQPDPDTAWASFGITSRARTDYPVIRHFNGGPDRLTRWSAMTMLVSVYGPNAQANAEALRDALYVPQNGEALGNALKVVDVGEITAVPDLVNVQWVNRADLEVRLSVATDRDYAVLDLASSEGTVTTADGVTAAWDVK